MEEPVGNTTQGRVCPENGEGRLTDNMIRDGFDLLRLGHLDQTPFTTPNEYARSFERCSRLRDDYIVFTSHTGV